MMVFIARIRKLIFPASLALALGAAVLIVAGQTPPPTSGVGQKSDHPWVPVKFIDFSSRHDVLIRNFDGSFSPMDEPHFQSKQIAPGTWQILSDGDYMYLVEGDNEALMIDAGYGAGNIREYAQSLSKKPLRYVANTHLHFDHTANNAYFDRAYMSAGTKEGLPMGNPTFAGVNFPRDYPIEVIGDGYKFQLGNRELEVILLGNHTVGGTAYLDRKQRLLYAGDEIMAQQGVALHVSVAQFAKLMEKLAAHRKEFDTICAGWEMLDASWVDKYLAIAQYILAGNEGIPAAQAPPAPLPTGWPTTPPPTDPAGRTIYIRHVPHGAGIVPPGVPPGLGQTQTPNAGGGRAGKGGPGRGAANANTWRMTYGGATVTYDPANVKDQ